MKKSRMVQKQKKISVAIRKAKSRRSIIKKNYCPYCNNYNCKEMTVEHVIPKSIGGRDHFLIQVCKDCNSKAGSNIDTLLSKHTSFRMMGQLTQTKLLHKNDRHRSLVILQDGSSLEGYNYYRKVNEQTFKQTFKPIREQQDGSLWVSEHELKDVDCLPDNINVLKDNMISTVVLKLSHPRDKGLEPAMVKIVLGCIYSNQGEKIVSSSSFDILRSCLSGKMQSSIHFKWLSQENILQNRFGRKRKQKEHIIWYECPDGKKFNAGVSLWQRGTIEFWIDNFGCKLPGQACFFEL